MLYVKLFLDRSSNFLKPPLVTRQPQWWQDLTWHLTEISPAFTNVVGVKVFCFNKIPFRNRLWIWRPKPNHYSDITTMSSQCHYNQVKTNTAAAVFLRGEKGKKNYRSTKEFTRNVCLHVALTRWRCTVLSQVHFFLSFFLFSSFFPPAAQAALKLHHSLSQLSVESLKLNTFCVIALIIHTDSYYTQPSQWTLKDYYCFVFKDVR